VDGGTNQLFDLTRNNVRDLLTPDLITGDFDSISPSVRTHYEELGARTVETLDQNFTDFTKALHEFFAGIGRNDYPAVKATTGNVELIIPKHVIDSYLSCLGQLSFGD